MNLQKMHEENKAEQQSSMPISSNESQRQSVELMKPEKQSLNGSDMEQIIGAIKALDNQQKKDALMMSELEKAYGNLAKQFETLQNECRENLSKQEEISRKTSQALLTRVQDTCNLLKTESEKSLNLISEKQSLNESLVKRVEAKTDSLLDTQKTVQSVLKSELDEHRKEQIVCMGEAANTAFNDALKGFKKQQADFLDKYDKSSQSLNKKLTEYVKGINANLNKASAVEKDLENKMNKSVLLFAGTGIVIIIAIILMIYIGDMAYDVRWHTQKLLDMKESLYEVSDLLSDYYFETTGDSLDSIRIESLWNHERYGTAILTWIDRKFFKIVSLISCGAWIWHFAKKRKNGY